MSAIIDMRDPAVQRLMGAAPKPELVQLAGDESAGMTHTINMANGKAEVLVTYRDFVLTVDVYRIPGEPIQVHFICPRCRQQGRITGDRKRIHYDAKAGDPGNGGELSVEPFQCTWEMPDAGAHTPGLRSGGATLCKWSVGITKNVALDH